MHTFSFFYCIFFFFKQKTAYEMRISDWSSDVCSSDLGLASCPQMRGHHTLIAPVAAQIECVAIEYERGLRIVILIAGKPDHRLLGQCRDIRRIPEIGRAHV